MTTSQMHPVSETVFGKGSEAYARKLGRQYQERNPFDTVRVIRRIGGGWVVFADGTDERR